MKRIKRRVLPELLFSYAFPLAAAPSGRTDASRNLVELDEAGLRELRARYPRELPKRKYAILRTRLRADGERGWLIADEQGTVCGYCHVALADVLNARISHAVHLKPGQAYFFDDYVFKAQRGRGLHAFSIARRGELLAATGLTEGVVTISRSNTASIRSYAKFETKLRAVLVFVPFVRRTVEIPVERLRRRG